MLINTKQRLIPDCPFLTYIEMITFPKTTRTFKTVFPKTSAATSAGAKTVYLKWMGAYHNNPEIHRR